MDIIYVEAALTVANIVIAVFTLVYGALFIIETVKSEHRKAWNVLIIAILLFLGFETFKLLKTFGIISWTVSILIFEISFNCVLLYAFVFQRELIQKSQIITIEKKIKNKR